MLQMFHVEHLRGVYHSFSAMSTKKVDFCAGVGYGGGMAKIKWSTTYSNINSLDSAESLILTGTFTIIKFRGMLFYYEPTKGHLIPVSSTIRAVLTGGDT